jgi:hypothetical protein
MASRVQIPIPGLVDAQGRQLPAVGKGGRSRVSRSSSSRSSRNRSTTISRLILGILVDLLAF